jgi:hypothetical protein
LLSPAALLSLSALAQAGCSVADLREIRSRCSEGGARRQGGGKVAALLRQNYPPRHLGAQSSGIIARQAAKILPIFNDFCPNSVSNVRLKMVCAFEGGSLGRSFIASHCTERSMRHDFFKVLRRAWRACLGGEGAYRPDLHYMRGPGPKWHAKYGSLAPKAAPAPRAKRAA